MPTTRFDTTIKALQGGAEKMPIEKAITNIEGWEEHLSKHDHAGVKAVVADLTKLKKHLQASTPDDKAIKTLLEKLGKDTTKVGDSESSLSTKIKELGSALSKG